MLHYYIPHFPPPPPLPQVSTFVKSVNDHFSVNINPRTHIVGFSLGAHVAGFAGADLDKLDRITGE